MGSSAKKAPDSAAAAVAVACTSGEGIQQQRQVDEEGQEAPCSGQNSSRVYERDLLRTKVLELTAKVDEIEKRVHEVNRLRHKNRVHNNGKPAQSGEQDKESAAAAGPKKPDALGRESAGACSKRMAHLVRQFSSLLRHIMQHKWAWPFMQPVDVEGLGLTDYFQIVEKPMDLGTIRDRMDAKDESAYKSVQEICEDVRLVFSNAMTYNEEGTDVHVMAKTLSEKFEEKWKTLESKLHEEEEKRKQATVKGSSSVQISQESPTENIVDKISQQLEELDRQLEDLKQQAGSKCRTMSVKEKRQLGHILGKLSPENLNRVIQIIAQKNPEFDAAGEEVVVDIDTLDPSTLWRLHRYVQTVNSPNSRVGAPLRHSLGAKRISNLGKGHPRKQRKMTTS